MGLISQDIYHLKEEADHTAESYLMRESEGEDQVQDLGRGWGNIMKMHGDSGNGVVQCYPKFQNRCETSFKVVDFLASCLNQRQVNTTVTNLDTTKIQ